MSEIQRGDAPRLHYNDYLDGINDEPGNCFSHFVKYSFDALQPLVDHYSRHGF